LPIPSHPYSSHSTFQVFHRHSKHSLQQSKCNLTQNDKHGSEDPIRRNKILKVKERPTQDKTTVVKTTYNMLSLIATPVTCITMVQLYNELYIHYTMNYKTVNNIYNELL